MSEWRAADPTRVLILASHNLPEVARIADQVLVLHQGRVLTRLEVDPAGNLEGDFLRLVGGARAGAA